MSRKNGSMGFFVIMDNGKEKTDINPMGAGAATIQIDWAEFDKLCELQCTEIEIASFFNCSVDTIERAVQREKNVKFADYYDIKRQGGFRSLRRKQYKVAVEDENVQMLIHLGKQWLNQAEKAQLSGPDGGPIETINYQEILANKLAKE